MLKYEKQLYVLYMQAVKNENRKDKHMKRGNHEYSIDLGRRSRCQI